MVRVWFIITGVLGVLCVVSGAIGAHAVTQAASLAVPIRIFDTAQLYHALHTLAVFGTALLLLTSHDRRSEWASWAMHGAALAFTLGVVCFSGGIYRQLASGLTSSGSIVPFGGICFMIGWVAIAVSAFGLRDRD